ncbi:hypothetical protein HRG_012584 [Hirsutella rhossiliensis]
MEMLGSSGTDWEGVLGGDRKLSERALLASSALNSTKKVTVITKLNRREERGSSTFMTWVSRNCLKSTLVRSLLVIDCYVINQLQATKSSYLIDGHTAYDSRVFRCLVISPAGRAIHKHISTYTSKAKFRRQCSHSQVLSKTGKRARFHHDERSGLARQRNGLVRCTLRLCKIKRQSFDAFAVENMATVYGNGSREYESNMFISA